MGDLCIVLTVFVATARASMVTKQSTCLTPQDSGKCTGKPQWSLRWYFNSQLQACEQFHYSGCFGNKNNFESKDECELYCGYLRKPGCSRCNMTTSYCIQSSSEFLCPCRNGFVSTIYGSCIDDNECNSNKARCSRFTYCKNTFGSYVCECKPGFERKSKFSCRIRPLGELSQGPPTVITLPPKDDDRPNPYTSNNYNAYKSFNDECKLCHKDASCIGNQCQCNRGYSGDGQESCLDIDECSASRRRVCAEQALCTNTPGSFQCQCRNGWAGNGFVCTQTPDVCFKPFDPIYRLQCRDGNWKLRYYYNSTANACQSFWYDGCGNKSSSPNFFDEEAHCKQYCMNEPVRPLVTERFPAVTATPDDGLIVPYTANVVRCFQPKQEGSCVFTGNEPRVRYYYDIKERTCKPFYYNGCMGNDNRFGTSKECERMCTYAHHSATSDRCMHPVEIGQCNGVLLRWYFNMRTGKCEQFVFTGCYGNPNQFESESECRRVCKPRMTGILGTAPPVTNNVDQNTGPFVPYESPNLFTAVRPECLDPPSGGYCKRALRRYYYDVLHAECRSFVWSGCGGNNNRFSDRDTCRRRCIERL